MSANSTNVEDAEMAECDGEKVVTMMDVLQEQQEFEDDANAVLGASDDKNCTYSKGYIKRQAVYACLTCCSDAKLDPSKRAGVCLACSLTCHENHDLVELYTKRNFCCDCGNPNFNQPCQHTPNKTNLNDDNIYNQNFSGLYCTCHRPYPDPDGDEEEMVQCIVCEDWLHASHLEATIPSSELYTEMICKACMEKNEFLYDYGKYAVNGDVDVVDISDVVDCSNHCNGDINEENRVDTKTELNESEKIDVCEEINTEGKNDALPIEGIDTNDKDNAIQGTSEEQTQPKDSVSEKSDVENLTENNQSEEVFGTTVDENSAKSIQDTNEHLRSDKIAYDKPDETQNTSPVEQEKNNSSEIKEESVMDDNKNNETINVTTDTNIEQNEVENARDITQESNGYDKDNKTARVTTDVSIEQTKEENDTDTPHEQNGCDASGEQQTKIQEETEFKADIQDKQGDLTDSTLMSATDKTETKDGKDQHETYNNTIEGEEEEDIKKNKRKLTTDVTTDNVCKKKPKISGSSCLRPQDQKKVFKGATFWPSFFRQKLCTCTECFTMYKDLSVLFLIDPEDTVTAYEVLGKEKADGTASTQYEKGLEALSSLGRIQQINALTEYNKMKDKLLDFLKSFKDRKEVVKEEDIKAFFAGMKPKREPDGVYFCR